MLSCTIEKHGRLTFKERNKIVVYRLIKWTLEEIGKNLNRSKSRISRELSKYQFTYSASKAQFENEIINKC